MKKYIIIAALALLAFTSCEKQWEDVPTFEPATKEQIIADGYTLMTVNDFKQQYFYSVLPEPGKTVLGITIEDKVALETVVVSSDELGNTYRSLYVQDASGPEAGGMEIKVGKGSMYTVYKPGQKLYIKTDELILGNYRNMVGLGGPSSESTYSNGFIDIQTIIDEKLLPGEMMGADTLVVNSSNISTIMSNAKKYLGTLCRFEGLESTWGTIKVGGYDNRYPSFMDSGDEATKNGEQVDDADDYNKDFRDYDLPVTWAYSYDNLSFYGSAAFTMGSYPFIVRTSGYSRFALEEIPADGEICDITAILTIYDSTYQLVLNSATDVVVK
ncbi:MAG: hypothetical protein J6K24_06360 [Tidjanibacter sp.]|nr:hypothetical protein [Tidjanibacter sp.]